MPMIICCKCGTLTPPSILNMCKFCSAIQTDITFAIKKHCSVKYCKKCDRYLSPPKAWISYKNQNEFISYLIKLNTTLSNLNIVKVDLSVDKENFKRMKMFISFINKNYLNSEVVNENTLEITYKINYTQCRDCFKMEDNQYWQSIVQVRQKNKYKQTFADLESLLHDSNLTLGTIKQCKNGLDFQLSNLNDALKLINFLKSNIICKIDTSNKLIAKDTKSNLTYFKNSFSVELCPINKDDLVEITNEMAKSLGVNQRLIVIKVRTELSLLDPTTGKIVKINNANFWKNYDKFEIICSSKDLKEFDVFEIVNCDSNHSHQYQISDVFVNNGYKSIHCKTHLTNTIKEGEVVLGYDLSTMNLENNAGFNTFIIKKNVSNEESILNLESLEI